MFAQGFEDAELEPAWIEGDQWARWRSGGGHGPDDGAVASGTSLLEVPQRCRLPRHTDSAEETIVVVAGRARVEVGGESAELRSGGVALVPKDVPHEVFNIGDEPLRFVAVYAGTEVVTTYERPIRPARERQRRPV